VDDNFGGPPGKSDDSKTRTESKGGKTDERERRRNGLYDTSIRPGPLKRVNHVSTQLRGRRKSILDQGARTKGLETEKSAMVGPGVRDCPARGPKGETVASRKERGIAEHECIQIFYKKLDDTRKP